MELLFQRADLPEFARLVSVATGVAEHLDPQSGHAANDVGSAISALPGHERATQIRGHRGGQRPRLTPLSAGPAVLRQRRDARLPQGVSGPRRVAQSCPHDTPHDTRKEVMVGTGPVV